MESPFQSLLNAKRSLKETSASAAAWRNARFSLFSLDMLVPLTAGGLLSSTNQRFVPSYLMVLSGAGAGVSGVIAFGWLCGAAPVAMPASIMTAVMADTRVIVCNILILHCSSSMHAASGDAHESLMAC